MVALVAMIKIPFAWKDTSQARVHVQFVEEVLNVKQEGIFLPHREAYILANDSLEEAAEHAGVQIKGTSYDLPTAATSDGAEHAEEPVELATGGGGKTCSGTRESRRPGD